MSGPGLLCREPSSKPCEQEVIGVHHTGADIAAT